MHRIIKDKTKALQIVVIVAFMVVAAFAAKPAQAKFGLMGGYKYVAVQGTAYTAHVTQLDFLWTIRGKGKGYRDGGKRPKQVFGFGLASGGARQASVDGSDVAATTSTYFAIPLIYEYVFPFGLGISGGISIPIMTFFGGSQNSSGIGGGAGIGISDLGVSYHLKNGLTFYARGNVGYAGFVEGNVEASPGSDANPLVPEPPSASASTSGSGGVMWGAGAGIGYWF